MTRKLFLPVVAAALAASTWVSTAWAPPERKPVDKWVTVTAAAAGSDEKAKDEAVSQALRKAVEQTCGLFLKAQSKTLNYKAVYDKILGSTVGYVIEHSVVKSWTEDGKTHARVRARVSTRKFEEAWAVIAHTIARENNPRVIIGVVEAVKHTANGPTYEVTDNGAVQTKLEDFFLTQGVVLMDRATAKKVSKRDVLLAALKDDEKEVAALGARFKADVVITGRASAKYGKTLQVEEAALHQYTASLTVRVVQTDSARVLAVKTYGPKTFNTLQRAGGGQKALAKLADYAAPKLLTAVIEAWRKRAHVSRTVHLSISGMNFKAWTAFKHEVKELRGVQALNLREITQDVAHIEIQYQYSNENLAETLTELKKTKLEVTEITATRVKLKIPG